jgi:hypothetical protein
MLSIVNDIYKILFYMTILFGIVDCISIYAISKYKPALQSNYYVVQAKIGIFKSTLVKGVLIVFFSYCMIYPPLNDVFLFGTILTYYLIVLKMLFDLLRGK